MKFFAATLVLFTALTAAMTYPQVLHLRDAVHDDGDPLLNTWALAWVAHQAVVAPAHLFDANIFYPERRTLAFSETLLLPGLVTAPLHWMGVGPLLVSNIVFLSGFILSGAGVALLVRSLTGCAGPAILAGVVFAFLPFRIDHYAHLQLQQTQCLPFALWAFHRLLRTGRLRDGVWFGLFTAGQMLSCMYYGLFLIPYFGSVCGTLLLQSLVTTDVAGRAMRKPRLVALALASGIVLLAIIPVGRAYLGARKVVGDRGREEVAMNSATVTDYLGVPGENALYGQTFERFGAAERRLFPGFIAVVLAIVGFLPRRHERTKPEENLFPRWAYLLGLVWAFDMSLGFNGLTYRVLYDYFLPFHALRIPARMGIMAGFSLAVLAGYGAARIGRLVQSATVRRTALTAIGVLMLVEYASKPIPLQTVLVTPPRSYADLLRDVGDSPTAPIFEFPAGPKSDPMFMYFSTFHWQHLVNGYSGFFPPWYSGFKESMLAFPDPGSMQALKSHGVRYVAVHSEWLFGDRYDQLVPQLDRHPELSLVSRAPSEREGQHGEISLYRVSYAGTR